MSRRMGVLAFWACMLALSCAGPAPQSIRLEAESGELAGVEVADGAYSQTGYVTGFDEDGDAVTFAFEAPAGLYELRIGYGAPHGDKGYSLLVNSLRIEGMLAGTGPGFAVHRAGRLMLEEGVNTITVEKGWGWYHVDYIELVPAEDNPPVVPTGPLADPDAGEAARELYAYLCGLYGRKTLAGQYNLSEIEWIREQVGREPAVGGFDLMDYSPSRIEHGADPHDLTESVIEWVRSGGGVVTLSWHWNAPTDLPNTEGKEWWRGFYTSATDFDLEAALADPDSERYRLLLRDMDAAAAELRKLDEAGIPALWRPLHEAEGRWFWWGAKGPAPFVELWRLMFRRYTQHHGLHNLIWVYTHGTGADADKWYPGDEFVDIVSADAYPAAGDPLAHVWDPLHARFNGRKLLALSEVGVLPPFDSTRRFGISWSWFAVWGSMVRDASVEELRRAYEAEDVITRDELPEHLHP